MISKKFSGKNHSLSVKGPASEKGAGLFICAGGKLFNRLRPNLA
jgi:hypothetical protein